MELPIPNELDFTEHWTNSIDKEVLRGIKVRDEKLKTLQLNSVSQYDLVNIDFTKPSCSKSYEPSELKSTLRSRKTKNSHRSISPQKRKKRYKKLKKNKRNDERNTCGMRIAELAVPSKRHCIETWKSKWDTLPTLMVDRLRQIVMDQKPIVPIQDAIICFKQKKTNVTRSPYKGTKTVESKRTKEIKTFCGIFGFRISAALQAPRNVTLGSRLTPISHVVNDEISRLLKKRKTSNIQKNIQLEIANKITNWIADVLEQSTYNSMLEDYTELEKEEGHIWDIIDELVDNTALLCKDSSISSSDVIDAESSDLNPSLIEEDTNLYSGSEHSDDNNLVKFENIIWDIIEKITSSDVKIQDVETTSRESFNDIEEYSPKTSPESIENYFDNFLSNYIDEITFNVEEAFEDAMHFDPSDSEQITKSISNDEIQNTVQNIIEENSNDIITEINNEANINNDFNEHDDNGNTLTDDVLKNEAVRESSSLDYNRNRIDIMENNFSPENIPKHSFDKTEIEIKDAIQLLPLDKEDTIEVIMNKEINNDDNIMEEKIDKIDETMPLTDITSDESIKNVKYSNINMDSGQGQLNIKSNIKNGDNKKFGTHGIHFAPPNDDLLSDADESWPENLIFPTVKATVSISKSVLSLGKINEDDEITKDPNSINENNIKASYGEFGGEIIKNSIGQKMTLLKLNRSNEQIIDEKLTNNDPLSVIKDVLETKNVESDREVQKDIDKNMVLLNTNRSNKNIIDEKLANNDPLSMIKDGIEAKNVELDREKVENIDKNINSSSKHVIDKNFTNNIRSVVEDIVEPNNVEKAGEKIQKIDKNINSSSKHVVDKNLTNNNIRSVVEDIVEPNNIEKSGESVQKIIGKAFIERNPSDMQVADKNVIDKNITQALQEVNGSPTDLKNKANETTDINIKRRPLKLSVKHLAHISICPEMYTQNIQCLGKSFKKDVINQIKPNETCRYIESEVRTWCHGLQNVIQNLDMWLDWIDNTCGNLLHLKQKERLSCHRKIPKYNNREWIVLKTNIDSDARLWKNLSIGLQVGLKSYKSFYQIESMLTTNEDTTNEAMEALIKEYYKALLI